MAPRKILLLVAALAAVLLVIPIGASLLVNLFGPTAPGGTPEGPLSTALPIMEIIAALAGSWWYPWLVSYAVGFFLGLWADAFTRMFSRKRAAIASDSAFDFPFFEALVKRARDHVYRDIQANGFGVQPRISMDAANEVLAVMLYLQRFGIATPMRGDYPHLPLQTFLIRSYHYLSLIEPRLAERDLEVLRKAENYRLAERESQLLNRIEEAAELPDPANDRLAPANL